jgi:hypothetical protein
VSGNILYFDCLWIFSEQNQRVFVYEDDLWAVKGRYEVVIEEDEEAHWSSANHEYTLKLLIVRYTTLFKYFLNQLFLGGR